MAEQTILVFITAPTQEAATHIAKHLLGQKLAACVNIIPSVRSIFTWQGERQEEGEVLLVVKSRLALFAEHLVPAVTSVHPYEVPEILALPVIAGYQPYLDWVEAETRDA